MRPRRPIVKALLGLAVAFLATVVGAKLAFETTAPRDETDRAMEPWAQSKMDFVAWNNQRWTAWIREEGFELVPQNTSNWSRHFNSTIAFVDWEGEPWQAKIDGDTFVLAHRGHWEGETKEANAIRYRDWSGHRRIRTVSQLRR